MREGSWNDYYEAVKNQPAHRTLLEALGLIELEKRLSPDRLAIDLGCGTGRDTLELLRRGWKVLAVDSEPDALQRLRSLCLEENLRALDTALTPFESMTLPSCDLVNASLSLPFVRPDRFESVWKKVVAAITPGGWFAGHFFGQKDDWSVRSNVTTLADDDVRALFSGFEIKSFTEKEEDGKTVLNEPKHWHYFSVVARKPSPKETEGAKP